MKITEELIKKLKMNKIKITMKKVTTETFTLHLDSLKGLDTGEMDKNILELFSHQEGENIENKYFISQCNDDKEIFGDPLVVFGKPGEFTDDELKDFFKLVNKDPEFILKKYQEHLKSKGKMEQNQKYVPIDPNKLKKWINDQVKLAFYYNYKKPVIVDDPKDLITIDDKAMLIFNMNPKADFEEIYDTLSPKDSEDVEEYILKPLKSFKPLKPLKPKKLNKDISPEDSKDIEEYYLEKDEKILPDKKPSNPEEIDENFSLETLEIEEPIISDEEEYVMEEFDRDSPEEEFEPLDDEDYQEKDWIDEE